MEKDHRGELNICLYLVKRFKANLDYVFLSHEFKESCNWTTLAHNVFPEQLPTLPPGSSSPAVYTVQPLYVFPQEHFGSPGPLKQKKIPP